MSSTHLKLSYFWCHVDEGTETVVDWCTVKWVISRKNSIKLLGIIIDNNLNLTEHVESVRHKCYMGLSKLSKLQKIFPYTLKINALILPHLDYCSVVWSDCSKRLKDHVQWVQNYGIWDWSFLGQLEHLVLCFTLNWVG